MDKEREKDIQELCKAVTSTAAIFFDNPNGAYESTCPFCYTLVESGNSNDIELEYMQHKPNCAFLIARDLSTKK